MLKTRPNHALTQEVRPANDVVDGRWPQEHQDATTGNGNSSEAKVQKRTTPNNTATTPAPMATPEQVGRLMADDVDGKDDVEKDDDDDDTLQVVVREVVSNGGDSPEEHEKEERRRAAQRVLLKQG